MGRHAGLRGAGLRYAGLRGARLRGRGLWGGALVRSLVRSLVRRGLRAPLRRGRRHGGRPGPARNGRRLRCGGAGRPRCRPRHPRGPARQPGGGRGGARRDRPGGRLVQAGALVGRGAVVDRALGEPHVRLFEGRLVRGQLPQPHVGTVRHVADAGQRQTGDAERAVLLGLGVAARLVQRGDQLLALFGLAVGCADAGEAYGVAFDELPDGHVGHQLSAPDDDEVVGRLCHLAHQVAGDEDSAPFTRQTPHQVADPQDALGVEPVDGLVEEQHLRVAEQRRRDAEPLAHAEGEALGALLGDVLESDDAEHFVHPAGRDAGQLGQGEQMVAGAAPAVHGLGVEQGADLPGGVGQAPEGVPADGDPPGGGGVEPQDHAHGGGFPRAVGPQESGHGPWPDLEGQVVDGRLGAVALRQAVRLDHLRPWT
ncbi:hypothetical protein TPA0909_62160 [Streptomyces albus]|nr:hypothetical protein TPA0909_62160 [Streptomyces albus]